MRILKSSQTKAKWSDAFNFVVLVNILFRQVRYYYKLNWTYLYSSLMFSEVLFGRVCIHEFADLILGVSDLLM